MALLHILYDARELVVLAPEMKSAGIRHAVLPVPDKLEGRDIYEVARKLAELLLEQIEPGT